MHFLLKSFLFLHLICSSIPEKFPDVQFIWGAPAEWLIEDIFRPRFVYPNCRYFSYNEILKKLRNEKLDG